MGEFHHKSNSDGLTLRKQALEALETSTKMLEVAVRLLKQGNRAESDRVRDEARTQRTISTLLLAEANKLELNSHNLHYSRNTRPAGQTQATRL
jgi:hypothetical protein